MLGASTFDWLAAQRAAADLTLFIHLRQPGRDEPAAQADGPPLDGWYPTSWWEPGEQVTDPHHFLLPADMDTGRYQLVVGWYNPLNGKRAGSEWELGEIEVIP